MDAKKILRDLQYRIDSTPENDPERDNAIRVRDRLLAKFNLTLDDLQEGRSSQVINKLTRAEASMLAQFLQKQFGWEELDQAPHCINIYKYRSKSTQYSYFIQVELTADEAQVILPVARNLLKIFRRELTALEKKIREEAERRRKALHYEFYDRAGILRPASDTDTPSAPSWGLKEAMEAASALEGIVFPVNHLNEEQKQLPSQV